MPAPKGHPLWGNPIKPKKYTPEKLWEKAIEYFQWCDENPIKVIEQSKMPQRLNSVMIEKISTRMMNKFLNQIVYLPHQRAYCLEGFCNFANIALNTFYAYESDDYNKDDKTYLKVCSNIRQVIDEQHLTGGMAGIFNANIVTRKLGLKEQSELSGNIGITWNEQKTYDPEQKTNNSD